MVGFEYGVCEYCVENNGNPRTMETPVLSRTEDLFVGVGFSSVEFFVESFANSELK